MDIKTLQKGLTDFIVEPFYIFVNSENSFLSNQYINEISLVAKKKIEYIENVMELIPNKNDIFGAETTLDANTLYVSKIDKFEIEDLDLKNIKNLIIVCNGITKESKELFKDFIIEMPKLEDWQIKDYVYSIGDGVKTNKLDWLISICNNDIYRLDNELSKLSLFHIKERDDLFGMFADDGVFSDLSDLVVFDLTNAVIKKDIKRVGEILEDVKNFDCEPLGVNTILVNSFKNIINIQLSREPTAAKLNMKPGQFYALRNNCGFYTKEQLIKIFDIITDAEYKMKTGVISNEQLIDYMIVNIFSL